MAQLPNQSLSDLLSACARLKRALAQVQCAVLDLHEAFLARDVAQRDEIAREAHAALERIRSLARNSGNT